MSKLMHNLKGLYKNNLEVANSLFLKLEEESSQIFELKIGLVFAKVWNKV